MVLEMLPDCIYSFPLFPNVGENVIQTVIELEWDFENNESESELFHWKKRGRSDPEVANYFPISPQTR